jgi:hypothetical protein
VLPLSEARPDEAATIWAIEVIERAIPLIPLLGGTVPAAAFRWSEKSRRVPQRCDESAGLTGNEISLSRHILRSAVG